MEENNASRTRSEVGRVLSPVGALILRPPADPPMIRVTSGSCLLQVVGLLGLAQPLEGLRVSAMHGRLAADEKDATRRAFAAGDVDVLVSTPVSQPLSRSATRSACTSATSSA
jgi:hypothetical protein